MPLTEQERSIVTARVAALEARTGTQVVTAVVGKSDSYPEAPWKAFALGVGAAAMAGAAWRFAGAGWGDSFQTGHVLVMLGSGAFLALLATLWPAFARLLVDRTRRDAEVMQFAESLFFRRGLDRTRGRLGILLLASLLERKIVILADEGFDGRVGAPDWGALTRRITLLLRHDNTVAALRAGLDGMEALLLERGFCGSETGNELSDAVLETKDLR